MFRFLKVSTVIVVLGVVFGGLAAADVAKVEKKDPRSARPAELDQMSKAMTGTWTCTGQGLGRDMKLGEMVATSRWSVDVGGWWLRESFDATVGKETPHIYEAFTTFDPMSKKWKRVMVTGGGGWNTGEATATSCAPAPNGCKLDWELSAHTPRGDFLVKDHVDATDLKAGIKDWGELSRDSGKTWMKAYELTCKR